MRYVLVPVITICLALTCLALDPAAPPATEPAATTEPSTKPSIIYVIDGSGSMIGGKDLVERQRVQKSVQKLDPNQLFNVIQFQENKPNLPVYHFIAVFPAMVPADDGNKKTLNQFIDDKAEFHGTTDAIPALEEAFSEKPQIINLITDGDFDDDNAVFAKIAELNADKSVRINAAIVLGAKDSDEPPIAQEMRKMTRENGGVLSVFIAK